VTLLKLLCTRNGQHPEANRGPAIPCSIN